MDNKIISDCALFLNKVLYADSFKTSKDIKKETECIRYLFSLLEKNSNNLVVEKTMLHAKCPKCGNLVVDTDNYCSNCGQKIVFEF